MAKKKKREMVTSTVAAEMLGVSVPTVLRNCRQHGVGLFVRGRGRNFVVLSKDDLRKLRSVMHFKSGRPAGS